MADKTVVLITGGNTGLGYEAVKALCQSSSAYEILLGSRSVEKGQEAASQIQSEVPSTSSTITVIQIDVSSDSSIETATKQMQTKHGKLDILINNAGASFDREIQTGNLSIRAAFNKSWDTNVAGTQVLTTSLAPLLLRSQNPRLLFITSGTSALAETERHDHPAFARINASPAAGWPKDEGINPIMSYRSSKTGLNMLMTQWHRLLKEDGVKVWAISPGFLATGLGGIGAEQLKKMGARDPSEGGRFIRDVVEGKRDGETGKVIRAEMVQPW
ncbi:NAD(P)-binding protein [Hortaea werneckii]|nr:NAD(P)-binding protein [Hortaea werneckii]